MTVKVSRHLLACGVMFGAAALVGCETDQQVERDRDLHTGPAETRTYGTTDAWYDRPAADPASPTRVEVDESEITTRGRVSPSYDWEDGRVVPRQPGIELPSGETVAPGEVNERMER